MDWKIEEESICQVKETVVMLCNFTLALFWVLCNVITTLTVLRRRPQPGWRHREFFLCCVLTIKSNNNFFQHEPGFPKLISSVTVS